MKTDRTAHSTRRPIPRSLRLLVAVLCLLVALPATAASFRDDFNGPLWTNNDGTDNWSTAWFVGGNASLTGSALAMRQQGTEVRRAADLSAYASASLVIDYATSGNLEGNDRLEIQASADGSNWTTLQQLQNDGSGTLSFDISAQISSTTWIRLLVTNNTGGGGEYFFFDYVEITATPAGAPAAVAQYNLDALSWTGAAGEVLDASGNGLNGTAINGATPVLARVCNGASLDGAGAFINVPDNNLLDISGELTVTAWFNADTVPSGSQLKTIVSKDENYEFHIENGEIYWWWNTSGGGTRTFRTSGANIAAGRWYHVAIVYSRSLGQQRIYLDGVNMPAQGGSTTNSSETLLTNADPLQIGGDQGFAGREFDGLIDEVRVFDQALSPGQVGAVLNDTRPCRLGPVAYYPMDEGLWTGAAGEVTDATGNGNPGTALGNANSTYPGYICAGGLIPLNTTDAEQDAVDTGVDVDADIGNQGTISFWYQGTDRWRNNGDRTLFDASIGDKYFFLVLMNNTALRFGLEDDSDADHRFDTQGNNNFPAGEWVHIAATWDLSADRMEIYINGTLDDSFNFNSSGALGNLGTLYLGDNRSNYHPQGSAGSAWGMLDEARIYDYVQTQAEIQADMAATHACSALAYFVIDTGGTSASTCFDRAMTISAYDAANNLLTNYTGTVTLSTSSGNGDWSTVNETGTPTGDPAAGVLDNGSADDGVASYSFDAADGGSVSLYVSNDHADDLTVTVDDAAAAVATTSTAVSFRDNAFVITPLTCTGASCAGPTGSDEVVAGRPHQFETALWRRDATSGDCAIATQYTSPPDTALKAWLQRDANDPGGAAPSIAGASLPSSLPAVNNLDLAFTNGVATFTLDTTDVGRYDLYLRDDSSGFAVDTAGNPRPLDGSTATLTVRPFALGYSDILAGLASNPGGTATTGAGFVAAGDGFAATVGAYRWDPADDANNDGLADDANGDGLPDIGIDVTNNGLTPAYAWDTTQAAVLNTPAAPTGTSGVLAGSTTLTAGDFSAAEATGTLSYDEVGSIRLRAQASGFLGSGYSVIGASPVIGRFYPADFELTGGGLTEACLSGGFTYMDQDALGLSYQVRARNRAGDIVTNYTGDPTDAARPYDVGTVLVVMEDDDDGIERSGRLNATLSGIWISGQLDASDPAGSFVRLGSPDGPFDNLRFGVQVNDPDGALISIPDMNATTTGDCSAAGTCDARSLGTTSVRYGRLDAANAGGSEVVALTLPVYASYFTNGAFVRNTLDQCTGLAVGDLSLSNPSATDVRTGAIAVGGGSSTVTLANVPAADGDIGAVFTAPGAGNTGYIDVLVDLSAATGADLPWLAFDWDGDALTAEEGPRARATFGIYDGSQNQIYIRELY